MIHIKYKCKCVYLITDLPVKSNIYICPNPAHQDRGNIFLAKDIDIVTYKNTNEFKFSYIGILDHHIKDEYRRSVCIDLNFKFHPVKKDKFGFIHEILKKPIINTNEYQIMTEYDIPDHFKDILKRELAEYKEFKENWDKLLIKEEKENKLKNPDVYLEEKKSISFKEALARDRFKRFDADALTLIIDNLEEFMTSHVFYTDKMLDFSSFFVDEFASEKQEKKKKKRSKSNNLNIIDYNEVI